MFVSFLTAQRLFRAEPMLHRFVLGTAFLFPDLVGQGRNLIVPALPHRTPHLRRQELRT